MLSNRELHYRYAISYLVAALIACIGFGLYSVPELVGKVEFSLTVTSLIVGLVAIVYTFLTANKQDIQLAKLLTANSNISSASHEIKVAATNLAEQISALPPRFDSIEARLTELSKGATATLPEAERKAGDQKEPTITDLRLFLVELNYAGMAVMYLARRAFKAKVQISEGLLAKEPRFPPLMFAYGVLVGASGARLFDVTFANKAITVEKVSPVVEQELEAQLEDIKKAIAEHEAAPILVKLLAAVDKMFSD